MFGALRPSAEAHSPLPMDKIDLHSVVRHRLVLAAYRVGTQLLLSRQATRLGMTGLPLPPATLRFPGWGGVRTSGTLSQPTHASPKSRAAGQRSECNQATHCSYLPMLVDNVGHHMTDRQCTAGDMPGAGNHTYACITVLFIHNDAVSFCTPGDAAGADGQPAAAGDAGRAGGRRPLRAQAAPEEGPCCQAGALDDAAAPRLDARVPPGLWRCISSCSLDDVGAAAARRSFRLAGPGQRALMQNPTRQPPVCIRRLLHTGLAATGEMRAPLILRSYSRNVADKARPKTAKTAKGCCWEVTALWNAPTR